jgi:SpoVK/Ycf46/Vps4 family AAA+-type ATPase
LPFEFNLQRYTAGRREILATHLRRLTHNLSESQVGKLAAGAHGFVVGRYKLNPADP